MSRGWSGVRITQLLFPDYWLNKEILLFIKYSPGYYITEIDIYSDPYFLLEI